MTQEFLDIVDENDIPTGEVKSRTEVHQDKKYWHRTVSIWIVNSQGQFLCQQRSWKKDGNPGKWQSYFGGHVKAWQSNMQWCQEELLEEIGIDIRELKEQPVFINKGIGLSNKHFGYYYVLLWNGTLAETTFHDWEVEQAAWMDLSELRSKMEAGEFCNEMSEKVLEYLSEKNITSN